MVTSQLLATTYTSNSITALDKIVDNLSKDFGAVWVVVVGVLLVYAIKSLLDFNKGNHSNKVKIHDNLDQHAFQNAVVPLLFELNEQLKDPAISNMQLDGSEDTEAIIDKYEQAKINNAAQTDLSNLESSMKVTDALAKMLDSKNKRTRYDRSYRMARECLIVGIATLSLNMLAGVGLIVAHIAFNASVWARGFLLCWAAIASVNIILAGLFIYHKTRMDGYIDEG